MMAQRRESIPVEPPTTQFTKPRVSLLLATDEFIPQETRVGLAPRHLTQLRHNLAQSGVEVDVLVMADAGARAGFEDDAYRAVDATIVTDAELTTRPAVDVVHALKEPTDYESRLPGPFLRIGAVHLANKPPGVCAMLHRRNFAGIVDGGTVGNFAYLLDGGDRTPIVGSMSRFAGWVAAGKLVKGVQANGHSRGKVVVVGGGIAGRSAIERVQPLTEELVVVERYAPLHSLIDRFLRDLEFEHFSITETLDEDTLNDAVGVVFAHRSGALAAEKVCSIEQIRRMKPGAGVADIAIDQGGSILHSDYVETDDAVTSRNKTEAILGQRYFYYAEVNMPREEPRDASEMHGESILAYLETLLLHCAIGGGPLGALEQLRALDANKVTDTTNTAAIAGKTRFECLTQDLRNGLQIAVVDDQVVIVDEDLRADTVLGQWLAGCMAD